VSREYENRELPIPPVKKKKKDVSISLIILTLHIIHCMQVIVLSFFRLNLKGFIRCALGKSLFFEAHIHSKQASSIASSSYIAVQSIFQLA
jgi:hypothetical protein